MAASLVTVPSLAGHAVGAVPAGCAGNEDTTSRCNIRNLRPRVTQTVCRITDRTVKKFSRFYKGKVTTVIFLTCFGWSGTGNIFADFAKSNNRPGALENKRRDAASTLGLGCHFARAAARAFSGEVGGWGVHFPRASSSLRVLSSSAARIFSFGSAVRYSRTRSLLGSASVA